MEPSVKFWTYEARYDIWSRDAGGAKEHPNHAPARPTREIDIDFRVPSRGISVAGFQLDVAHDTVTLDDQIVTSVVDLTAQHFDIAPAFAQQTTQQVHEEERLQDFSPVLESPSDGAGFH